MSDALLFPPLTASGNSGGAIPAAGNGRPDSSAAAARHSCPPGSDLAARRTRLLLHHLAPPMLVLLASLSITWELWRNEEQNTMQNLQRIFDHRVQDYQYRVEAHLKDYERLLRGMEGLFASSTNVSRREFREFVEHQRLGANFPGIRGLCFTRLIQPQDRQQYEAAIRQEGFSDFAIWPEGERGAMAVATYLEPFIGHNQDAFGFDGLSEPVRRAAMERARDTGEAALSSKVPPLNEQGERPQAHFRMYLPVYRNGQTPATTEERRVALVGWLYISFRMSDFIDEALGDHKGRLDTEIYDGANSTRDTLVYDSDPSNAHIASESNALFKTEKQMDFLGHRWILAAHSLPDFDMRLDEGKQHVILQAGIGANLLLTLLTWLLLRSRRQAMRHATELGQELAERKQAETGLRLTAAVIQAMEEAVMVTDRDNNIVSVNPAFTAITGYRPEEVLGRNPRMFASGGHDREFFRDMWNTLLLRGSWHGEIWDRMKNGQLHVKWLTLRLLRDEDGNIVNHVAVFSDISERKRAEERLQRLAHHDALTGLPNRILFEDRLAQALSQARRGNLRAALIYIDLDRFKPVNDTLGHAVGDLLLKETAERLLSCVRESDTVSRRGGDEFVVLLPAVESAHHAMRVAEKISQALSTPFRIGRQELHISASTGVALYPEHGGSAKQLEQHADAAMYRAKQAGGNAVRLHQEGACPQG